MLGMIPGGWLVLGWLIGWLIGWLFDWLVSWLVGWLMNPSRSVKVDGPFTIVMRTTPPSMQRLYTYYTRLHQPTG